MIRPDKKKGTRPESENDTMKMCCSAFKWHFMYRGGTAPWIFLLELWGWCVTVVSLQSLSSSTLVECESRSYLRYFRTFIIYIFIECVVEFHLRNRLTHKTTKKSTNHENFKFVYWKSDIKTWELLPDGVWWPLGSCGEAQAWLPAVPAPPRLSTDLTPRLHLKFLSLAAWHQLPRRWHPAAPVFVHTVGFSRSRSLYNQILPVRVGFGRKSQFWIYINKEHQRCCVVWHFSFCVSTRQPFQWSDI